MARRKKAQSRGIVRVSETVRVGAARPQPIVVRVAAPKRSSHRRSTSLARYHAAPKRRASPRRSGGGGGGSAGIMKAIGEPAMAGVVVGWINKQTTLNIPTVPMLGRAGTLALVAYWMRGKFPFASTLAPAFAAIAGYEYMKEGSISGDDLLGVASQV